jgi:hypothetical protein
VALIGFKKSCPNWHKLALSADLISEFKSINTLTSHALFKNDHHKRIMVAQKSKSMRTYLCVMEVLIDLVS